MHNGDTFSYTEDGFPCQLRDNNNKKELEVCENNYSEYIPEKEDENNLDCENVSQVN